MLDKYAMTVGVALVQIMINWLMIMDRAEAGAVSAVASGFK